MEENPSGEADSSSPNQEGTRMLWNLRIHYLIHNSRSLFHTLSHINLSQALSSVFKAYFNIIFSHLPIFLIGFYPSEFPQQDPLRISPLTHTCHQLRPSYPPSFDHPCYIWRSVRRYEASHRAISSTHLSLLSINHHYFHPPVTFSTYPSLLPSHLLLLPPTYHFFQETITTSTHLSLFPPTYHFFQPPITSYTPPITSSTLPITSSTHLSLLSTNHHYFHPSITSSTYLSLLSTNHHYFHTPVTFSTHLSLLPPTYHFFHLTYHFFHPPITSYFMIGTPSL